MKKTSGPGDFTGKVYQVFKDKIIQTVYKIFQIIEEGTLPN